MPFFHTIETEHLLPTYLQLKLNATVRHIILFVKVATLYIIELN
jgi:hypothetical protein